jgi:hypothetical protein
MICGKEIYRSQTDAAQAMRAINDANRFRSGENSNRLGTTYYCEDCPGWHIASKHSRKATRWKVIDDYHKPIKPKEFGYLHVRNYSSQPV